MREIKNIIFNNPNYFFMHMFRGGKNHIKYIKKSKYFKALEICIL